MRFTIAGIFLLAALLALPPAHAAESKVGDNSAAATDPAAEKLWADVMEAVKPPAPPPEWNGGAPNEEQLEAFKGVLAQKAGEAADKAREFYTKYPNHPKAAEAQQREKLMLSQAVRFGATERLKQLEASPALTDEEKFEAEVNELNRRAMEKQPEGLEAVLAEFEKGTRELMKKHPDRTETWQLLFLVGQNSANPETSKRVLNEIRESEKAPEELKERALGALKKIDAVGHPLELSFTSMEGKKIDIQEMDGKVVLVDFWATWCGPCVQELPNVKKVYEKYHPQGFEIVGISFDKKKETLEEFVKEYEMPWPQYFDGQGWGNKFGAQYNITAIPTMWLVDKKGLLRDLNARPDLEEKVKELLAEK